MPLLTFAACVFALSAAGAVIAAPFGGDHPIAVPEDLPEGSRGLFLLALAPIAIGVLLITGWWRLPKATSARSWGRQSHVELAGARPGPGDALALLAGGATMLVVAVIGVRGAALAWNVPIPPGDLAEHVQLAIGAYSTQLLLAAFLVHWWSRRADPAPVAWPRSIVIAVMTLFLIWPIVNAVGSLLAQLLAALRGVAPDPLAHEILQKLAEGPSDVWAVIMMVLVVVAAPIVEEVIYRGCLQRSLRRAGIPAWPAIAVTSLVFALMHVGSAAPHTLPALFVLSLGFGWLLERTGRLVAPTVMHALFNLGNLAAVGLA